MNAAAKAAESQGEAAPANKRRGAARLAAVQVLYEMEMAGAPVEPLLGEFLHNRWKLVSDGGNDDGGPDDGLVEPDGDLLADLVRGVSGRIGDLDGMIGPVLSAEWPMERLEVLLRAILRAGAQELSEHPGTPPKVIISEYVEVAHAFFAGSEAGLVNGVLDSLARGLRPGEM